MEWIDVGEKMPQKAIKCWVLECGKEKKGYFYPECGFIVVADE